MFAMCTGHTEFYQHDKLCKTSCEGASEKAVTIKAV